MLQQLMKLIVLRGSSAHRYVYICFTRGDLIPWNKQHSRESADPPS